MQKHESLPNTAKKKNEHHLLYSGQEWSTVGQWAKVLRNSGYYKKNIPQKLHAEVHRQVLEIHPPSDRVCEAIYGATMRAIQSHAINIRHDTVEQRIEFFLSLLRLYGGDEYGNTVLALSQERKIFEDYYSN